jgi:hypothetical protein
MKHTNDNSEMMNTRKILDKFQLCIVFCNINAISGEVVLPLIKYHVIKIYGGPVPRIFILTTRWR